MAIQIKDQPKTSYHDFDITDAGYDMSEPYTPEERGVGAAEGVMFLVVVMLCVPIVYWFCEMVAYWIAG